jgi:hypothetical protein
MPGSIRNSRKSEASQAAEKGRFSGEIGRIRSSGAKARVYSVGFMRGLKPPSPSGSSFSAACKAPGLVQAAEIVPAPEGGLNLRLGFSGLKATAPSECRAGIESQSKLLLRQNWNEKIEIRNY